MGPVSLTKREHVQWNQPYLLRTGNCLNNGGKESVQRDKPYQGRNGAGPVEPVEPAGAVGGTSPREEGSLSSGTSLITRGREPVQCELPQQGMKRVCLVG